MFIIASLWPLLASAAGTPVTVKTFDTLKIFPKYTAPGTAVSLNDSQISAQVTGVIETVAVKPGDSVNTGDTLVKLDCRDHELAEKAPEAQLQAAKAERDLARYRSDRADALKKKGAMPLEKYQQRKAEAVETAAEVRRLQAVVEESQRTVEKCDIKAPFRGVVVERLASVGELANPGMRLLRLVDTQDIEVSSQVQEQDLNSLRKATHVNFVSRGASYPIQLRSVVPVLDRRISSYEVRFQFSSPKQPAPGQSGRVVWSTSTPYLPADLLVQRNGNFGVFLAINGHARFRALANAEPGQPAAVKLPSDAKIIIDGRYGLDDGQAITRLNADVSTPDQ